MTQPSATSRCAVCGSDPHGTHLCEHCGARLPTPVHAGRGPLPPPVPRAVPEPYRRAVESDLNALRRVGTALLWGVVTAPVGLLLRRRGIRQARAVITALESGVTAPGVVTGVRIDHAVGLDDRHPWRIDYTFTLPDGRQASGFVRAWSPGQRHRHEGEPTWVVHLPGRDAASSPWPPLA